jgi:hypothetical protein
VISYLAPADLFPRFLGNEALSLPVMLLVGIPMYICASASTPVAAALVLKGLSPGAALVFLLAGPATNAATLTVVGRFWGRKATAVYLAVIASCSLGLGWLTDLFYTWAGLDLRSRVQHVGEATGSPLAVVSAVLLLALIARAWLTGPSDTKK